MSEENLGRVQGAGFFFSTAVSSTSADMATLSPSTIKPVYGDNIIFANGDIRNITAVSDTAVTCGGVVANLQGTDGVHIISSVLQGQDAAGGNIYLQTFSDNTTATFTAPRGLEGLGILYSSADADAQTTLFAKDSVTIPAGREIKVGDIIFCNAHLFSVNAVSETSFSVIHLAYFSTDSAQKDGNGNVIVDTYATKSDLTDGTITVKNATNAQGSSTADFAISANYAGAANTDDEGNVIKTTYATKTQLSDGSVTKIGNVLKVGGTTYDGSAAVNAGRRSWYGTCATSAATSAKVVSCTGFVLETGAKISVRFTYENIASSPTLNVNSTGAKSIRNSNSEAGTLTYRWYPYQVVDFVYDGTYWLLQQPYVGTTTYYGTSKVSSLTLNGSPNATPSFYAPTVDTGGRWLRGTGLGEPEWSLPINIHDSYKEISSNQTVPDLGVGHTGVICYFTSSSSTFTIYLPSSGEWAFAYQISNSYYNGAVEEVSNAKSVAWRDSSVSGGNAMCSIKGNGKYTSIMIIYTRTK